MKCPKCGNENPDTEQICAKCGYTLTEEVTDRLQSEAKAKISKLALSSAISPPLFIIFVFLYNPILAYMAAFVGIAAGVYTIVRIKKSQGRLRGEVFAITGVIITTVLILFVSCWRVDAAAIPDDYTIFHLSSAASEYDKSFEILKSLANESDYVSGAPAIGLSEEAIERLTEVYRLINKGDYNERFVGLDENKETILLLWQKAEKGRRILSELDKFPEIADLSEPFMDTRLDYLSNLRHLSCLCRLYVSVRVVLNGDEASISELIRLDSVIRKLNLNARVTVTKLVCLTVLSHNINTASFVANSPDVSQETLRILTEHFQPIDKQHTSLRNSMIYEYLTDKNELHKLEGKVKFCKASVLKVNSTLRYVRNFFDYWLAIDADVEFSKHKRLKVWPWIYPDLPVAIDYFYVELPWYYKAYNPVGSKFIGIVTPEFGSILDNRKKPEIHSDLLQIVLNKRLGKAYSLKARAYSDEYIIDIKGGKVFSPGPDGEPNTEDDIKLMINPEVFQ